MRLRVAGAQMPVSGDIAANAAVIARAIEFAAAEQADVLLTPEGSLSGYTHDFDPAALDRALERITEKARKARLALALGTCRVEPEDGLCYDQIRFYDRGGQFLGFHAKILRCGTFAQPPQGELNHYATRPLRAFLLDGLCVGGLICNDLWANPCCTPMPDVHLTQQLARLGARIILHAVNGGRNESDFMAVVRQFHEANLRMRARSGRLWIVTADNCTPEHIPCSAPSGIVDPEGNWLVKAPLMGEYFFCRTIEGRGAEANRAP